MKKIILDGLLFTLVNKIALVVLYADQISGGEAQSLFTIVVIINIVYSLIMSMLVALVCWSVLNTVSYKALPSLRWQDFVAVGFEMGLFSVGSLLAWYAFIGYFERHYTTAVLLAFLITVVYRLVLDKWHAKVDRA